MYKKGKLYLLGLVTTLLAALERSQSGFWYPHRERQRAKVSKVDASTEKENTAWSRIAEGDAHR